MVLPIDKSSLTFCIGEINRWENNDCDWESYQFSAEYEGHRVGRVVVDRIVQTEDRNVLRNPFFYDQESRPQRPIPYTFYLEVEELYRGQGIAGMLLEHAHHFFSVEDGSSLHSGVINGDEAIRIWEKLVDAQKAVEYEYAGKRKWRFV